MDVMFALDVVRAIVCVALVVSIVLVWCEIVRKK